MNNFDLSCDMWKIMALLSKAIMNSENLVFVTHRSTEQNYKHAANWQVIHHTHPSQKYQKPNTSLKPCSWQWVCCVFMFSGCIANPFANRQARGVWEVAQQWGSFPVAVFFKGPCLLWLGVRFDSLDGISSSVSESRELGCWGTVFLGILQLDLSQSFAWLLDFLTCVFVGNVTVHTMLWGCFFSNVYSIPLQWEPFLLCVTIIIHLHHLC